MHAVLVDQRLDGVVVAFGLDPHQLAQQHTGTLAHLLVILHPDVRLAVLRDLLDAASLVLDVVGDEGAITRVILLNGRTSRDAAQLRERNPRGVVVHRPRDGFLIGNQAQFLQLRIPHVPERHQVCPRFFERGEVLLQVRLGASLEAIAQLAGAMADHFVHGGHEIFGFLAVLRHARHLLGRGGVLLQYAAGTGRRDCVAAPGKEEVLRSILFADFVLVRQVHADRRDMEVAGFDQDLYGFNNRGLEGLLAVLRIPGRGLLEERRVLRELRHRVRDLAVGNRHEAFRAAFPAARIAIHLDEAVGEIDGGVVAYPAGAELQPVLRIAGVVVADQIGAYLRLRWAGDGPRLVEELDRLLQVRGVRAWRHAAVRRPRTVHLLADRTVRTFHDARVERMALGKRLQILQGHAAIERVRARLNNVLARRRRLRRCGGLDVRVEDRRAQRVQFAL